MANEMTTRHGDAKNRSPERRLDHGSPTTWHQLWTAPFRAIRAIYWMLDRDAKVRSRGLQTVGRVTGTRTEEDTDSEGDTYYTHYVRYRFEAEGRTRTDEKKVGSLGKLSEGDPMKVYYLSELDRLDSALDWEPVVTKTVERTGVGS